MAKMQISQVPWYAEDAGFFGPGFLKVYGEKLTHERTLAEINFLEKILVLKKGVKILDCPCGHGRHSIELARRGYNVTGQDLNGFFLKEAKKAAKHSKVSVHWVKSDMRDVPFENEFDFVLNLYNSFGYLESDEEDQKALDQVANVLKLGGTFVLEINNRDHIIRSYREKDWRQLPDGSVVISEKRYDQVTGRNIEKRVRIWNNCKREEHLLSVRMYTVAELAAMFRKAGLAFKEIYGNYNGGPFTFDSEFCILVAEKS